jgi:cell division protein FtsB
MIKKISFIAGILIVIFISYNLISQILRATGSYSRLDQMADEVYQLEDENKILKKRLTDVNSPTFVEQQAREKLGLAKLGETVVLISDEKIKQVMGATEAAQVRLPNWLGWWKVFFH